MGRTRRKNKRNVDNNTSGTEKLHHRSILGTSSGSGTPAHSGDDLEPYIKPTSRNNRRRGFGKLRGRGHDDAANKAKVEASPESFTKNNGDVTPSLTTAVDAQAGFSGNFPAQETTSPVRQLAFVDRQDEVAGESEEGPAVVVNTKESDGGGDGISDVDGSAVGHLADISAASTTTPSAGRGAVVPTLPLGSNRVNGKRGEKDGLVDANVVEVDSEPYSLAWAGGRKGRPLMKSVEDVLSDWLCTQEAEVGIQDINFRE